MVFESLRTRISQQTKVNDKLMNRICSEIEFAEKLGELLKKTGSWKKLIDKAVKIVNESDDIKKAIQQAEEVLAPIAKVAKTYTIHCVGHAHIDMNWQWPLNETVAVINDTFTTVLKLMDEFPDFCFTQSQTSVYELVRKYNPEMFEKIKKHVASGRWEIAASHWVEEDKNLSSGESLVRQILYTRRYMKEHFGLEPEDVLIDWSVDTFGHAHTIPMINANGAVRRYILCRPGNKYQRTRVFWWQGPDRSRVLVHLLFGSYNGVMQPQTAIELLNNCALTGLRDWLFVYGVGDHGGGPTRRDIMRCHEMNLWPVYPNCVLTTTDNYFSILEQNASKFPTINEELNFEFEGCYTSQSQIKKINRLAENQLVEAELCAALAHRILNRSYPTEMLREAWIDTLFGQFHDILSGSSVRATRQYQQGLFQKTSTATGMIKTLSYRQIAANIDTSFAIDQKNEEDISFGAGAGRGTSLGGVSQLSVTAGTRRVFVVFNPSTTARNEVVEATLWDVEGIIAQHDINKKSFIVKTPEGKACSAQVIRAGNYWKHKFVDMLFPASVASAGYSTFMIEEGKCEPHKDFVKFVGKYAMENEFISVDFDSLTGGIIKLVDKKTNRDLASPARPLGVIDYIIERAGSMSSWVIHETQNRVTAPTVVSLEKNLSGPYLASITAKMMINESTVSVTYAIKAGQPWLDITVSANWLERGGPSVGTPNLGIAFPFAITKATAKYEIPYGTIERKLNSGQEVPALRWADVTGASAGCALLNNSKYGHSLNGSTLRLTLIRSSYEPDPLPELGEHIIQMALVPHGKKLSNLNLINLAAAFNSPLSVVATDAHNGRLPSTTPAIAEGENIIVSSIKKSEEDSALVFRLQETEGKKTAANVILNTQILGKPSQVIEVDILEREAKKSTAKLTRTGFRVEVPAQGIASVKVTF